MQGKIKLKQKGIHTCIKAQILNILLKVYLQERRETCMFASLQDTLMRVNTTSHLWVINHFSARPDMIFRLEFSGAGHAELVHFHLRLPAQAVSS